MSSLCLFRWCVYSYSLKHFTKSKQILGVCSMSRIARSMDPIERVEKILQADKDIEQKIMALRCEVSDVEARILDDFIISRLEKENKELEDEIDNYKRELAVLEKLNGRRQMVIVGEPVCKVKESSSAASPTTEINAKSSSSPGGIEAPQVPESKKAKKDSKKTTKNKNEKSESKQSGGGEEPPVDIGRLDLKVGKILQIEKHPDADTLYVEKVDIGKQEPITVVSGLVKHISENEMLNSLVIILCNLKPAKMRGITSEGMVMCASVEGKVEVLRPPPDAIPGDVVTCPGYNSNPDTLLNPKKKIFETVAPDLITDSEMTATYKGIRWNVGNKGPVKAQTLTGANIK